MSELLLFMQNHSLFSLLACILNIILAREMYLKLDVYMNSHLMDAMSGRNERQSLYGKVKSIAAQALSSYESKDKKAGIHGKSMKQQFTKGIITTKQQKNFVLKYCSYI